MSDDSECFICLYGDEEVGKGNIISLKMTRCGCSPYVHSVCLVEWYTGTGADGRDICPVCRTRGRIQGIAEILQRVVLSGDSSTSLIEQPDRYHFLPDTEHISLPQPPQPPQPQPPQPQPQPQLPQMGPEDEQRRNREKVGVMFVILILIVMFVYAFTSASS